MKFRSAIQRQRVGSGTRIMAVFMAVIMLAYFVPVSAHAAVVPTATDTVTITETTGSNGFTHPGVGLTKLILDNMRQQVIDQKDDSGEGAGG